MSLFVRKIIKSKWYQTDIENGDDVSADAITNCMKTKQNTLSVWEIESPDELDNAVLAIVSQHQHLETIDVVKLDSVSLVENEIVWVESRGLTPIDDLVDTHFDLSELTYPKLGIIVTPKTKSIWYPHKENDDVMSIAFELDESA